MFLLKNDPLMLVEMNFSTNIFFTQNTSYTPTRYIQWTHKKTTNSKINFSELHATHTAQHNPRNELHQEPRPSSGQLARGEGRQESSSEGVGSSRDRRREGKHESSPGEWGTCAMQPEELNLGTGVGAPGPDLATTGARHRGQGRGGGGWG